jgi:hypothetical protein
MVCSAFERECRCQALQPAALIYCFIAPAPALRYNERSIRLPEADALPLTDPSTP